MRAADLESEMRHCLAALEQYHARFLVACGIDPFLIAVYGMVGVARIAPGPARHLWIPNDTGQLAFVTPARVHHSLSPFAPDPWSAVRFGSPIDLVAWDPRAPHRWLSRTGDAIWLGSAPPTEQEPFPAKLRDTVLSWLGAGAEGIVLLSSSPRLRARALQAFEHGVIAETPAQRRSLAADLADDRRQRQSKLLNDQGGDIGRASVRRMGS